MVWHIIFAAKPTTCPHKSGKHSLLELSTVKLCVDCELFIYHCRYLNKLYSSGQPMSSLPTNVCYLATDYPGHASCGVRSLDQFSDPHVQLEAFRQRARRMVGVASSAYQRALGRGLTQPQAWNSTTVDWTVAAKVSDIIKKYLNFFLVLL